MGINCLSVACIYRYVSNLEAEEQLLKESAARQQLLEAKEVRTWTVTHASLHRHAGEPCIHLRC